MAEICEITYSDHAHTMSTAFVPDCLESIVDKKVNGIALNIFEWIVDWLASWLHNHYNTLLEIKIVLHDANRANHPVNATSLKIHRFMEGMPLYDITTGTVSGIKHQGRFNLIQQTRSYVDFIELHNKRVFFCSNPDVDVLFTRAGRTKYVIVEDEPVANQEDPMLSQGRFRITEQETGNTRNQWIVDTKKNYELSAKTSTGLEIGSNEQIYLIENPRQVETDPSNSIFQIQISEQVAN
jgi:hypothetical protein